MRPTKRSSAPIQKEGTGPKVLPMMKEHDPQSKGGGRPKREGGRWEVQVQFNLAKWEFANVDTGDESMVRRKEDDEEVKMVCLVEVTVVQVVVEMVVKLMERMGFLVKRG